MKEMYMMNAADVRKEWSSVMDKAVKGTARIYQA